MFLRYSVAKYIFILKYLKGGLKEDMEKGSPYSAQQPPPPQYNQPPPAYAPVGQQTAATVVIQQPQHVLLRQTFREVPVRLNCQSCQADIMTATHYETGMLTWMAVGIICLFGGWLGCCLIPFCVDACKDVVHTCPNCKQMVGKYNRLS